MDAQGRTKSLILTLAAVSRVGLAAGSEESSGRFRLGRLSPSGFDLDELNSVLSPGEAASACDRHRECAGFTYKGLLNYTSLPDQRYPTYFVRYVATKEAEAEAEEASNAPNWVTYLTSKRYSVYDGMLPGEAAEGRVATTTVTLDEAMEECDADAGGCAGFAFDPREGGTITERYRKIRLDPEAAEPHPHVKTYLSLGRSSELIQDVAQQVNTCCPGHGKGRLDFETWTSSVKDGLERVSCDMSAEEFTDRYVNPRIPVILTGCTGGWTANGWTSEGLLSRYEDHVLWNIDYEVGRLNVVSYLSGKQLLDIKKENSSSMFRIMDRLVDPWQWGSNKMDLMSGWTWPHSIPRDLFKWTYWLTDYVWVIMGDPDTGTAPHTDPVLTAGWNSLLQGHKHWVLFPTEVEREPFLCDFECSDDLDYTTYTKRWYLNVLPQLRKRKWFGRKIIEAIQRPGETVFIPHGVAHSILNLDRNLAVAESLLPAASIDLLAKFAAFDWKPLRFRSSSRALFANLVNRDLRRVLDVAEARRWRDFGRRMLEQVLTVTAPANKTGWLI